MSYSSPSPIYHPFSRGLHWLMALIMIGLLALGLVMSGLDPSPQKWQFYSFHKAMGMIALVLITIRIVWRLLTPPPTPLASHAAWERGLARITHILLYVGMVAMPVSGYVMSAAGGHNISFFGLFDVPLLIDKNEELGGLARTVHEIAGYTLIAVVVLHILGALKHVMIDRDATLRRMVG